MTFVVTIPHLTHVSILFFIHMFPMQSSVETEVSLHAPNQSLREELVPAAKVLEMDVVMGFEDGICWDLLDSNILGSVLDLFIGNKKVGFLPR